MFHTLFHRYKAYAGSIEAQPHGSLVSLETGTVNTYGLRSLEQRGTFFVKVGDSVYAGQVVGEHIRDQDLVVNVCRTRHVTNHRQSTKEVVERLTPPRILSLDDAMDYLGKDELLEVTPEALRVRKRILHHDNRGKAEKQSLV